MDQDDAPGAVEQVLPPSPPPAEVAPPTPQVRTGAQLALLVLAVLAALYVAAPVALPVALALLVALLLRPAVRWLECRHVPASVGALVVLVALGVPLAAGVMQAWAPATAMVRGAPETLDRLRERVGPLRRPMQQIGKAAEQVENLARGASPTGVRPVELRDRRLFNAVLVSLRDLAVSIGVTLCLLYFLLAYGDLFLEKLVQVLPNLREKKRAVEIARDIERQVSVYLLTVTLINLALGAAVGFALQLAGLPNPWLWGAVAVLLNFVPYIGATVGIALVGIVSLVTFPTLGQALVAPGAYLALTILEGNFITPIVLGRRFSLNPIVIFVAVLFWGWMWGIGGALLAVPMLAVLKILCEHIAVLQPLGSFLES